MCGGPLCEICAGCGHHSASCCWQGPCSASLIPGCEVFPCTCSHRALHTPVRLISLQPGATPELSQNCGLASCPTCRLHCHRDGRVHVLTRCIMPLSCHWSHAQVRHWRRRVLGLSRCWMRAQRLWQLKRWPAATARSARKLLQRLMKRHLPSANGSRHSASCECVCQDACRLRQVRMAE